MIKRNILLITFVVILVLGAGFTYAVTRVIDSDSDDYITYIRNSNGKYWAATSANIQTAINDLTVGGIVWLPDGTFDITDNIEDNGVDNITLVGTGIGTLIAGGDGVTQNIIHLTSVNNWTLKDFAIDGNNLANAKGGDNKLQNNIYIEDCNRIRILGVDSVFAVYHGIILDNSHYCIMDDVFAEGAGFNQLDIYAGSSYNIISNSVSINCTTDDTGVACIKIHGGNNNTITGNTVYANNTQGIGLLSEADDNIVSSNTITCENQDHGIFITGAGCSRNVVIGNTIRCGSTGIYIYISSGIRENYNVIDGNTIDSDGRGIYIRGTDRNIISNNMVDSGADEAIRLYGDSDYNSFYNNVVISSATALSMTASDENNLFLGNNIISGSFTTNTAQTYLNNLGYNFNSLFPFYDQAAEPSLNENTTAWWRDTDNGNLYIVADSYGTQVKIQLT